MDHSETLTSLAMLKVNFDVGGKDYIDYLLPFVAYVLVTHRSVPVTTEKTRDLLADEFGLHVAIQGVESVIRRLAKKKYLKKEHHQYYIARDLPVRDIQRTRQQAKEQMETLISSLLTFASSTYGIIWDADYARSVFLNYLARFSIECLSSYARGTALPEIQSAKPTDFYVLNAFIRHIKEGHEGLFDSVIVFVKGHMLANALICPDLNKLQNKFSDLACYLDTPLILDLLNLQGEFEKAASEELLDLVTALGGSFKIFAHTRLEVDGVLSYFEKNVNNPNARGRMVQEMRKSRITPSDLTLFRARLDDFLLSYDIELVDTPEYTGAFQIDETILESALDEEIRYLNPKAAEFDVNSIRSIYALRRAKEPKSLEGATAVLVTSNAALAWAAYKYGRKFESSKEVSSVVTDYSLANLAWLKAPLRAPDLPRFEVLAICYAAMEPKEALWAKYVGEIEKLRKVKGLSAEMHAFLRISLKAREELMNLTLGSEEGLSEQTVEQVIEKVTADLTKDTEAKLIRAEADAEHAKVKADLENQKVNLFHTRSMGVSRKVARVVGRVVQVVIALILLVFLVLTVFYSEAIVAWSPLLRVLASIVLWLGIALTLFSHITPISVSAISRRMELLVKRKVSQFLLPRGIMAVESEQNPDMDLRNSD